MGFSLRLTLFSLTLLALTLFPLVKATSYTGYSVVTVYPDGGVLVEYRLLISSIPSNITLRVPRDAIYVSVVAGGEPTPYTYNPTTGLLSFPALYPDVTVKVYTLTLTSKSGALWTLDLGLVEMETYVKLPEGSLLVSVEPRDFKVRILNGTMYMVFNPSSRVKLEYTIITGVTITQTPIQPPGATITPQQETTPTPPKVERPWYEGVAAITLTIITLAILATAILAYLRRRGMGARPVVEPQLDIGALDERDKAIIDAITKQGGEATAPEIQRVTGIPKTPLYRKLEKLEKLGYIESYWRGGQKIYRIKRITASS